jgi:hypothetical protein
LVYSFELQVIEQDGRRSSPEGVVGVLKEVTGARAGGVVQEQDHEEEGREQEVTDACLVIIVVA